MDQAQPRSPRPLVTASLVVAAIGGIYLFVKYLGSDDPQPSSSSDTAHYNELSQLGYEISDQNKVVAVQTGQPFTWKGAKNFDAVSQLVTEHIQKELGNMMEEIWLPEEGERRVNVFCSKDWRTSKRMVLIIQSCGKERAGIWSRKLMLTESLDSGSMLPYVQAIQSLGWSVVISNPNTDKNSQDYAHLSEIYDRIIAVSQVESVAIVAFGSGGQTCINLMQQKPQILEKLRAIAFVNSLHTLYPNTSPAVVSFLIHNSKNWVPSSKALGLVVRDSTSFASGCNWVSGGHVESAHCLTTASQEIFKYFRQKFTDDL